MTREIFFFENHAENEAGRLVPDVFFFFFLTKLYMLKTWSELDQIQAENF